MNMTKKYFQDDKCKVHVCKMTAYPNAGDRLKTPLAQFLANMVMSLSTVDDDITFVGKATCHDLDKYDEATGRNLASSRADLQYHQAMVRDYKTLKRELEVALADVDNLMTHHKEVITKTNELISRISNVE